MSTHNAKRIKKILHFWFSEVSEEQKFKKDDALDAEIKDRFEDVYWNIMNGKTESWRETPRGRLAEIIVLDQFARNMFRGSAQAFAGDALALSLAQEARAVGADMEVSHEERLFFYMPYMHSEDLSVHEEAVKIFTEYGNEFNLEYEMKHKEVLERFGRYPHRNKALGRESTPEERKWLASGGGF